MRVLIYIRTTSHSQTEKMLLKKTKDFNQCLCSPIKRVKEFIPLNCNESECDFVFGPPFALLSVWRMTDRRRFNKDSLVSPKTLCLLISTVVFPSSFKTRIWVCNISKKNRRREKLLVLYLKKFYLKKDDRRSKRS